MRWTSMLCQETTPREAAEAITRHLRSGLGEQDAHLILLFIQSDLGDGLPALVERVVRAHATARVVGCTGATVLASGREAEGEPGIAVLAAHLPDVAVVPFRVTETLLGTVMTDPPAWHRHLDVVPEQQPLFLLLPDPFTGRTDALVASLDAAYPGAPKIGGLASGGRAPGDHQLVLDQEVHRDGAVAVALYGDVALDTVVAQGARPVGPAFAVTAASENLIAELDGGEAGTTLKGLFQELPQADRERFQRAPMVGLASGSSPGSERDFLIRDLLGIEKGTGRVAVNARVRPGMTVRFHVRDPQAAEEDLRGQLMRWRGLPDSQEVAAAVLFSCLGRGTGFFGTPDHDSGIIRSIAGEVPLAGFFCNGELGPVHGTTWMHGYTSVVGLFRRRGWS